MSKHLYPHSYGFDLTF